MSFGIGVSGVWRNSPRQWIGVSGVWRPILGMWIGVSGAWRRYFALGAVGSIFTGQYANSSTGFVNYWGYQNLGGTNGTISGATFPNGVNVIRELSNVATAGNGVRLSIGGFSSNPGIGWLNMLTCNGTTLLAGSSGFSYSASLGVGTWQWPSNHLGMGHGFTYDFVVVPTNP